jgi:hypothetical protein
MSGIDRTDMDVSSANKSGEEKKQDTIIINSGITKKTTSKENKKSGAVILSIEDDPNGEQISSDVEDTDDNQDGNEPPRKKQKQMDTREIISTMMSSMFQELIKQGVISKLNRGDQSSHSENDHGTASHSASPSSSSSSIENNNNNNRFSPLNSFNSNDRTLDKLSKVFPALSGTSKTQVLAWCKKFESRIESYSGWSRLVIKGDYSSSIYSLSSSVKQLYPNGNVPSDEALRWYEAERNVDSIIKDVFHHCIKDTKEVQEWFNSKLHMNANEIYSDFKLRWMSLTPADLQVLKAELAVFKQGNMTVQKYVDEIESRLTVIESGDSSYNVAKKSQQKWEVFKSGIRPEMVTIVIQKNILFEEAFQQCLAYEKHPQINKSKPGSSSSSSMVIEGANQSEARFAYCEKCKKRTNHSTEQHRRRASGSGGNSHKNYRNKEEQKSNSDSKHKDSPKCYNCGRPGHKKPDCYSNAPIAGFTPREPFVKGVKKRKREDGNSTEVKDEQIESMDNVIVISSTETQATNYTILDGGATAHCFQYLDVNNPYVDTNVQIVGAVTNGKPLTNPTVGSAWININGARSFLKRVLVHPGFRNNLISEDCLIEDNQLEGINHKKGYAEMVDKNNKVIARIDVKDRLLKLNRYEVGCFTAGTKSLLHGKLGHINNKYLMNAFNNEWVHVQGGKKSTKLLSESCECTDCLKAKSTLKPLNKYAGNKFDDLKPRDHMQFDLVGPITPNAFSTEKYALTGIDAATRFKVVIPIKTKDEAVNKLIEYNDMLKNQYGSGMKLFYTDQGTEFKGEWTRYCKQEGILTEVSPRYRPALNGLIERANRTLVESARTMMVAAGAPNQLWNWALKLSAKILNFCNPSPISKGKPKSTYQSFTGKDTQLDANYLHLFGSDAYMHIPKDLVKHKFDAKSVAVIWIGFEKSYALVMDPVTQKVYKSESVRVSEGEFELVRELKAALDNGETPADDNILKQFCSVKADEDLELQQAIQKSTSVVDDDIEMKYDESDQVVKKKLTPEELVARSEAEHAAKLIGILVD